MMNDELVHVIKGLVQQAMQEFRPFVYAHISNWDPVAHAVRVVVPSIRDDQTGDPLMSGWLPLGTMQAGNGVGIQVAPLGGASTQNPTAGEQVLVALNERGTGVASVVTMFFNNKSAAPSPTLVSTLKAGEMVATSNGIVVRWHSDGTFEVTTNGPIQLTAQKDVDLTSIGGKVSIFGNVQVELLSGKVYLGGPDGAQPVARLGDHVVNGAGGVIGTVQASTTVTLSQ